MTSKINELLSGKKSAKERVNVYVGSETYSAFKHACEINGLSVSETVDALMADFVVSHGPAALAERSREPQKLKPVKGGE